ncbi:Hypothetical protein PHPALM_392 [Phytophthora palmivora]|uniref:Jacalin-type lectin domain-containing protein n=1 Tax=Phytophthora palmivora TaxID=4796 RepID=A0A2P4YUY5_9STRA|nr:Hypothetical protein PHPALM_392 [Phytophthora palmivora]
MKFIYQVLASAALAASCAAALEEGVILGESFGEPYGDTYSDLDLVGPGQTVESISIRSGKRVDAVIFEITDPSGQSSTLHHGGGGGDKNTLKLGEDEYITSWEAQWGDDGDRIQYIVFTTNKGNSIGGGVPTGNSGKDKAPKGYQLGGFIGCSGRELDQAGAIWTSIKPMQYQDYPEDTYIEVPRRGKRSRAHEHKRSRTHAHKRSQTQLQMD